MLKRSNPAGFPSLARSIVAEKSDLMRSIWTGILHQVALAMNTLCRCLLHPSVLSVLSVLHVPMMDTRYLTLLDKRMQVRLRQDAAATKHLIFIYLSQSQTQRSYIKMLHKTSTVL